MKKVLKVFAILLTALTLCIPNVLLAKEFSSKPERTRTNLVINEYTLFKDLKSKSTSQLKEMGFDDNKITELKSMDFVQEILQRSIKHTDNELANMGYTLNEIQMLRNFKGTEQEIITLANNNLEIGLWKYSSSASNKKSTLEMSFDWNWRKQPLYNGVTDALAFAWSREYNCNSNLSYATARYYQSAGSEKDIVIRYNIYDKVPGRGAYFRLPMSTGTHGHYCKSGTGRLSLYKADYVASAEVRFEYGHRALKGTPTVSFPGGVSIKFDLSTSTAGFTTYEYLER